MSRSLFGSAMEGRRALWLALIVSAAVAVSFNRDAATAYEGGQPAGSSGRDTNVLCVSKCGTCPTLCSSSPPPPPPSDGSSAPPGTPSGGGSSSPSSPSLPGQKRGGHPGSYYYFFTAGSGRRAGPSGYALVSFMVLVSLAANFQ